MDDRVWELLDAEADGWRELQGAFSYIGDERFGRVGVTREWSARDVAHHIAYWMADSSEALAKMQAGTWRPVAEDREEIERTNLAEGERSKSMDSAAVRANLSAQRTRLRDALVALDTLSDEAIAWFDEAATEHYEEHLTDLMRWAQSSG